MARSIDQDFYNSPIWRKCAKAYLRRVGGLCEICLKNGVYAPANIVHHKKHLNRKNMNEPSVAYNFDNLQAVCIAHHNEIHKAGTRKGKRWEVDNVGHIIIKETI